MIEDIIEKLKNTEVTDPNYANIALQAVQFDYSAMQFVNSTCQQYSFIAKNAVSKNYRALQFVNQFIDDFLDIASIAINSDYNALSFINKSTPNYVELFKKVSIHQNPNMYCIIAVYFIKIDYEMTKYVDSNFEYYYNIIKRAFEESNDYRIIQYVPTNFSRYYDLADLFVKRNPGALRYISKDFDRYSEIALEAIRLDCKTLQYVSTDTSDYYSIVKRAVEFNFDSLNYVSNIYTKYNDLISSLVSEKPDLLETVSGFVSDEQYVDLFVAVIISNPKILEKNIGVNHPKYIDILKKAIDKDYSIIKYVDCESNFYRDLALLAIRNNPKAFSLIIEAKKSYIQLKTEQIEYNGFFEYGASLEDLNNVVRVVDEIVSDAMDENHELIRYLPRDYVEYAEFQQYESGVAPVVSRNYVDILTHYVENDPEIIKYVEEDKHIGYDSVYWKIKQSADYAADLQRANTGRLRTLKLMRLMFKNNLRIINDRLFSSYNVQLVGDQISGEADFDKENSADNNENSNKSLK